MAIIGHPSGCQCEGCEASDLRSTIERLQAELAKCQAANASWQESYCKRHNDSIERLERAEKAESALAAANARIVELEDERKAYISRELYVTKSRNDERARAERAEADADSLRATINNMRAMNIKLTFEAMGKVLAAEAEAKALREALHELHLLIDFDAEWKPCDCFADPSGLVEALDRARAALASCAASAKTVVEG